MAQLIFYDDKHVYEVDGVRVPSVSEIIRFLSREEYGDINQYTLDNAAERGTAVHKACYEILRHGDCEVDDGIVGYVRAFVAFCKEHKVKAIHLEKAFAVDTLYAGTIDFYGEVDGELAVVDYKTVSAVKKTLVKAQVNGYRRGAEHQGWKVDRLYCLQLMSDGKYRLYTIARDDTEFNACLALHGASTKKHGRGVIE